MIPDPLEASPPPPDPAVGDDRRRMEEELRTGQERLALAIEASELGTFFCPVPLGEIIWNTKCRELFWLPPGTKVDFDLFYSIIHPEERERTRQAVAAALLHKSMYDTEYRTVAPDGRTRWVRAIGRGFYDEAGELRRFDGVAMDVTKRKEAAEALAQQEKQLRKQARRLELLNGIAESSRSLTDPGQVMELIARRLGKHLGVSRCAYADVEPDGENFFIRRDYTQGCDSIVGHYQLSMFGSRVADDQRHGRRLVLGDVDRELAADGGVEMFNAIGIKAIICCPLLKDGCLVAMMAVHQTTPRAWTDDEVALVAEVVEHSWAYVSRARADREVAESEERFRSLVAASAGIVWRADREGCMVGEIAGWEAFSGQTSADHRGMGWLEIVYPPDKETVARRWREAVFSGRQMDLVCRLRRRDGVYRRAHMTGIPLPGGNGEVREWVGTMADVEDKLLFDEQREDLLAAERAARSEAERASRMKDEFLATLSHELRTPLNAILGWAQVLAPLPASLAEEAAFGPATSSHSLGTPARLGTEASLADLELGISTIERSARAQARIIEDLLDMSRIISGKVRLDVRRVDLAPVARAALDSLAPAAAAKGVALAAVLDSGAPPVSGDPERLQQVFWNLLGNAIKFTPRGGRAQVVLQRVDSHLEVSFSDSGEGVPAAFLPHVFDRFRQADASTTRRHGGLGMGLAIVKQLVELHGGTVRASSAGAGAGSTFVVSLPLLAALPAEGQRGGGETDAENGDRRGRHPRARDFTSRAGGGAAVPGVDLRGVRALVVDDEPDARALLRRLLEGRGAEVLDAGGAAEAFALAVSGNGRRPDVLVSDIGMPGEDGYGLIGRVRAWEAAQADAAGGKLPAVALTAYARVEDRMKAVLAGFQMHVAKPVEAAELLTMVASLTNRV